ncbi:hypothetical protein [Pseudomonas aeruginosa]|uniref:hypothetical protein n=1 Tax=Pseudomonas aeruginosa TaxID=287 RepID=UPI003D7B229A
MSNLPAIILVHGFWGGAAQARHSRTETPRPRQPACRRTTVDPLADDAERTRKMIAQQQGRCWSDTPMAAR